MPFPIVALFGLIKVACVVCGAAFCTHKITKAYKKNQDLKNKKLEYFHEERMTAQEANKKLQEEKTSDQSKLKEKTEQRERDQKELENAKNKANDPNLSEDERRKWRLKVVELEDKLSQDDNEIKSLTNRIKEIDNQIKNNNKIINSTGLTSGSDRGWIWEVLTLENILVCLAIYALYNIVRDERKH